MSKSRPSWLPVVAGLLRRDDKVLMGLRPPNKSLPSLWEFPGGKIEPGESPEVALQRELREELNINAEIGPLRLAWTHQYGELGVLLLFYEVLFWKGEIKALHHLDLKWTPFQELKMLKLPDANRLALDKIIQILLNSKGSK